MGDAPNTTLLRVQTQVLDTNASESYHSALKFGNKTVMQRFSLLGIIKHIIVVDRRYFDRAAKVISIYRTEQSAESALLPGLRLFPTPVQILLIVPEIKEGQRLVDDGELVWPGLLEEVDVDEDEFDWGAAACDCRFYRHWRLPCRHLLHHHFANDCRTLNQP